MWVRNWMESDSNRETMSQALVMLSLVYMTEVKRRWTQNYFWGLTDQINISNEELFQGTLLQQQHGLANNAINWKSMIEGTCAMFKQSINFINIYYPPTLSGIWATGIQEYPRPLRRSSTSHAQDEEGNRSLGDCLMFYLVLLCLLSRCVM